MNVFLMATTASSSQLRGLPRKAPEEAETASSSVFMVVKLPDDVLREQSGARPEHWDPSTLGATSGGAERSALETTNSGAGKDGGGNVGTIEAEAECN